MDERQARFLGLEISRREMAFIKGFISCTNCECNYHGETHEPTFCQIYCLPINPADAAGNTSRAEMCGQWVAKGLDRNKVVSPDHVYPYED